jgi:arylsulfatase A-like enzyme
VSLCAIRTEQLKYIRYLVPGTDHPNLRGQQVFPAEELYDIQSDPGEQNNLAESARHQAVKTSLSE